MKALIIKQPWIDLILEGKKTIEVRGSKTNIRGQIALIASGTGQVIGTCHVDDSINIAEHENIAEIVLKSCVDEKRLLEYYKKPNGWVLSNAKRLETPIKYKHPMGAIIWVTLEESVTNEIIYQLK
jgi:hypothetical protein